MPPLRAAALTRPPFTGQDFTPTRFDSAARKAAFANALCRFIAADFPSTLFTQLLYDRLCMCCGHIAHCDKSGFFATFFVDLDGKIRFLEQTLNHPCYGHPTHTYCDVGRAIQARLQACDILAVYRARRASEIAGAERALLAQLRAKYDGVPVIPQIVTRPAGRPVAAPRAG
ncbi:MAG: hypothetical protein M0Z28_03060 [Rhodospirillales bacterium]|nr:hypothetical protein [Rhodospirillales bacterium]